MNRNILISVVIAALALIFLIYSYNNRFVITNAGNGIIYKIDRWSGRTYLIAGRSEELITREEQQTATPEEKAINLAKSAHTLLPEKTNSECMDHLTKSYRTGELKIDGWEATSIDDQTFLVTYDFKHNDQEVSIPFEVNLVAEIVREVKGDSILEKKYGY